MFKHQGKRRSYIHNLRLAAILSFVAGIVNITGLLSVKFLTTNVTGHFAYFSEEIAGKQYLKALFYLLLIGSFLLGAFVSNMLIEIFSRIKPALAYTVPMIIEIIILTTLAVFGRSSIWSEFQEPLIACMLLFSMGLQNAFVTKASQSVVRTTHLTGLFTDLGIELSQLIFYRTKSETRQLSKSIALKLAIIGCFFSGCIAGGLIYQHLGIKTLLVASAFLIIALLYDHILFRFYHLKRRLHSWH